MNHLKEKEGEFIRDWTGLANPLTLGLVGALTFGSVASGLFVQLVLVWVLNELVCSLIKLVWSRPRPEPTPWSTWYEKISAGSFPSIHAARLAVFATFLAVSDRFDLYTMWVVIATTLVVGISRVILKKHFWGDVIGGWLIGCAVCLAAVYWVLPLIG
jgi:membrane-associated phospholipid phosphatase